MPKCIDYITQPATEEPRVQRAKQGCKAVHSAYDVEHFLAWGIIASLSLSVLNDEIKFENSLEDRFYNRTHVKI